jgi:hypothetical protein
MAISNDTETPINPDSAALDADLAGMVRAFSPPAGWERDNQDRKTIAQACGVDVATWRHQEKSKRLDMIDARRLDRATDAIKRLPAPGEYVHVITGQEFSGFDLIPAMLALAKAKAYAALTLTTLGFSARNLETLAKMIEAKQIPAKTLHILCSDFFRRADRNIWQTAAAQAKRYGYTFKSTRNHTKLILAAIGGKRFVVESSANLRSCANLEQFTMTQSKKLWAFHNNWLNTVWPTAEE